ncbi:MULTISPECIES: FAD-dependent monooxygenase [Nocardia]|uniref:FAD-binding domain-containing protein n=1 Tax=Nocardia nova TaxID=37330 RepID=A0A2T2Z725_9NOCA|nr:MULTISPECIES: FAD-dependent monooxygenase [Nocardia]MBF6244063.1 FAD-dependent monooxygenase [Nocardia elegans]PSR63550.1 hypothetical protein C8259_12935 [Nocardia nova]
MLTGPDGTENVTAHYLVGADGGAGTMRRTLGIPLEGTTDESIRVLLGDVRVDALDHGFGYWFATAAAPTAGGRAHATARWPVVQFAAPLGDHPRATRAVLQEQWDRVSGRTDLTVGEPVWSTVWRPNIRLAQRFRSGRVFLAGDAAHVHPPTGGQGMNTGIQDAYNLGWKLAAALDGDPGPLETHEPERRGVAQ